MDLLINFLAMAFYVAALSLMSAVVSAVVGSRKGIGVSGFFAGLLLGPFGLLLTWLARGDRQECPHCHELIHRDATACPRCTRATDDGSAYASLRPDRFGLRVALVVGTVACIVCIIWWPRIHERLWASADNRAANTQTAFPVAADPARDVGVGAAELARIRAGYEQDDFTSEYQQMRKIESERADRNPDDLDAQLNEAAEKAKPVEKNAKRAERPVEKLVMKASGGDEGSVAQQEAAASGGQVVGAKNGTSLARLLTRMHIRKSLRCHGQRNEGRRRTHFQGWRCLQQRDQ